MYIHQCKYVMDILKDVGLLHAKPALTPMPKGHKFSATSPLLPDPDQCHRLVGRLLYLTINLLGFK